MIIRLSVLASLLALPACVYIDHEAKPAHEASTASVQSNASPAASVSTASASIIDGTGSEIGTANLTGGPNGIMVRVELAPGSISPGWHGIHFHQIGDCSDLGVFKRSGGHMGLIEGGHGLMNPIGPESGDIPNIYAHANGQAGYEIFTNFATMSEIFDEDGTAIVIHANEDDHISQPIGGAGPRIACGVIN